MASTDPQIKFRLPQHILEKVDASAMELNRSRNEELRSLIEAGLKHREIAELGMKRRDPPLTREDVLKIVDSRLKKLADPGE